MRRVSLAATLLLFAQFLGCIRQHQRSIVIKTMSVDTELFLIDDAVLKDRVIPAVNDFLDRGDSSAANKLLHETVSGRQFQTALKIDRVVAEYLFKDSRDLLEGQQPKEIMDFRNTGTMIKNPEAIRRYRAEGALNRFFVFVSCAAPLDDTHVRVILSRGILADYVRSRSKWMDEMLSLSNEFLWDAQRLQPQIASDAWLLSRDEAATLLKAVQGIPPPSSPEDLVDQFNALIQILEIAVRQPRYRLLIQMG
jgi:hypothetical protein